MKEADVTFDVLAGTLTSPDGAARAGVLLLAGSGPTDRDWCSPLMPGSNGAGKLLAHALAARGYAVLRFDKAGSGGNRPAQITFDTWRDEARAALGFLRERAPKVFVAGHSEGGVTATRLAQVEPVAGVLLLAAAGRSERSLIVEQVAANLRNAANLPEVDVRAVSARVGAAFDDFIAGRPVDAKRVSDIPELQALVVQVTRPETGELGRAMLAFDPAVEAAKLDVPVFVWAGGRDIQVSPDHDAAVLAKALRDVTLHVSPEASHVLKHETRTLDALRADPASVVLTYAGEGALDDDATLAIAAWLDAH